MRTVLETFKKKWAEYLLEILVIVIGILVAFMLNTWNENNKSKKEASFQLSKLRVNLISDKAQLKSAISSDSFYIEHLIYCVKVLSNEIEAPKEEFSDRFQYISELINFNPIRGTFEGLVSSGKIKLINDQNLLDALFTYYNASEYRGWDSSLKDYSRNVIIPYLLGFDHISNGNVEDYIQFDISKFTVPSKSLDDYKNDLFLLNGLRFKIQLFEGQKTAYTELLKGIDPLINSIDIELNR